MSENISRTNQEVIAQIRAELRRARSAASRKRLAAELDAKIKLAEDQARRGVRV